MRMPIKIATALAVACVVALTGLSAGPALARPAPAARSVPAPGSVVAVGDATTQFLADQLAATWDAGHRGKTQIDSVSSTGTAKIVTKQGCRPIPRPNGSAPGIRALVANVRDPVSKKNFCVDFARVTRSRAPTDPSNVVFVPLALDNVTYATAPKSNAPRNLTTHDLAEIYTCTVTNWDKFKGGRNAPIKALLPQAGSGTAAFFQAVIGVSTPPHCVSQPASLEENEGTNSVFTGKSAADEIIPFSSGVWVAQAYHSALCGKKPTATQNTFGCDANGKLQLNDINGTSPVADKALSLTFTRDFIRTLFDVVRTAHTADTIPSYLEPFLGQKGLFCTNPAVIRDYGFVPTPACG